MILKKNIDNITAEQIVDILTYSSEYSLIGEDFKDIQHEIKDWIDDKRLKEKSIKVIFDPDRDSRMHIVGTKPEFILYSEEYENYLKEEGAPYTVIDVDTCYISVILDDDTLLPIF